MCSRRDAPFLPAWGWLISHNPWQLLPPPYLLPGVLIVQVALVTRRGLMDRRRAPYHSDYANTCKCGLSHIIPTFLGRVSFCLRFSTFMRAPQPRADGERLIAFEIAPATFSAEGVTPPERNVLPER